MNKIIENKVRNLFLKINLASNLSRKKFILDILLGMIESKKVTFQEILSGNDLLGETKPFSLAVYVDT